MADRGSFDAEAFYAALDGVRAAHKLNWRHVAKEAGVSPSTMTRLAQGKRPDVDSLAALVDWAGLDANSFVRRVRAPVNDEGDGPPLARISTLLRGDKNLTPQAAEAIDSVVRAAYESLREQ